MIRMTIVAILAFLFGLAGEAHARPIDEVGWRYDRGSLHQSSRKIASTEKVERAVDILFANSPFGSIKVEQQCGSEAGRHELCVYRMIDPANGAVCYSFQSTVTWHCLPRVSR